MVSAIQYTVDDGRLRPIALVPTAMFTEGMQEMQEAGEQVAESQQEMMKQLFASHVSEPARERLGVRSHEFMGTAATFKARVQSGGRISIPGPEREALDIKGRYRPDDRRSRQTQPRGSIMTQNPFTQSSTHSAPQPNRASPSPTTPLEAQEDLDQRLRRRR